MERAALEAADRHLRERLGRMRCEIRQALDPIGFRTAYHAMELEQARQDKRRERLRNMAKVKHLMRERDPEKMTIGELACEVKRLKLLEEMSRLIDARKSGEYAGKRTEAERELEELYGAGK